VIIKRNRPKSGIRFAWLPVQTSEGLVWLEWVHFRYLDHEFGGVVYERFIPEKRYDKGERAKMYMTPPDRADGSDDV
jgi:hypothetical protein